MPTMPPQVPAGIRRLLASRRRRVMKTTYDLKKPAIIQAAVLVAVPAGARVEVKNKADGTYPTIEHMIKSLIEEALLDAGITAVPEIIVEVLAKGEADPRWQRSRKGRTLQQAYSAQLPAPLLAIGSGHI